MSPWICRCLACGKLELKKPPRKGLCPLCRSHCAPAILATKKQAAEISEKRWIVVSPGEITELIAELGISATTATPEVMADIAKIGKPRGVVLTSSHLVAHRPIRGRTGFANGDLKTRSALRRAFARGRGSPFFPRPALRDSPSVLGKFIEAEFEFRSSRRRLEVLSLGSETLSFQHSVLNERISVEIDGNAEGLPVELKTVEEFSRIARKIPGILMQVSGQAIAKGVDSALLIIAERGGERVTAVQVSGLVDFHMKNIARWNDDARNNEVVV
jgi:hypothetical protein